MATEQRPTGPDGGSKHHPVREGRAIGPHGVGDPAHPGPNAHDADHHHPGRLFPVLLGAFIVAAILLAGALALTGNI
jgi:hypothetical protein